MRAPDDIIDDILEWRTAYDGQNLEDHLSSELMKLHDKTSRSEGFREQYIYRSGQLPSTMSQKLESCVTLADKWRCSERELDIHNMSIISDMLEFIVAPFYHFGTSASDTLSNQPFMKFVNDQMGSHSTDIMVNTGQKLKDNTSDYRRLGELLVELCDATGYKLAPNVRNFTTSPVEPIRNMR